MQIRRCLQILGPVGGGGGKSSLLLDKIAFRSDGDGDGDGALSPQTSLWLLSLSLLLLWLLSLVGWPECERSRLTPLVAFDWRRRGQPTAVSWLPARPAEWRRIGCRQRHARVDMFRETPTRA